MTSTLTIHHTPAALPSPTRHHLHLPTALTRRPQFLSVPPLNSSPSRAATTTRRNYTFVPTVIEQTPRGERGMDIFSRLLKERIICINGGVDDGMTHKVVAELTFLEFEDAKTPIVMYINSPGGSVTAGIGIYDTMQYIRPPITTICVGLAASMGSILLVAGTKGKRASLPHATIMIHQPLYGYQGQAKDMSIHTQHLIRVWDTLNNIYVKHTGQPFDVIQKETDRDNFMTPEEAKAFGIIDEVINKRPDSPVINAVKDKVLSENTEKVSNMEEVSSQPARVSF